MRTFHFLFLSLYILLSCNKSEQSEMLFELMEEEKTGIQFSNMLTDSPEFNVYKYRNYYNGGGVAIGDINNDGLADVYLVSNQGENQ
jgi:hypothetical protein